MPAIYAPTRAVGLWLAAYYITTCTCNTCNATAVHTELFRDQTVEYMEPLDHPDVGRNKDCGPSSH